MPSLRRVLALPLALTLSCGGAPRSPTAPRSDGARKTYAPLGIKDDAKAPRQAVILGTDANNGSTVVPLPALPTRGVVDAMVVSLDRGADGVHATGGTVPVKLSTEPNTDGGVEVGIYEELAGGTGTQWRAGVWVSAIVAAWTLGKDLTDFRFSAASTGYIDGASASGLMAGGFLATMTGAKLDATATMTGIINPDGTIGPVGGIPEKFAAAIAKGKKRLGYPIGMRWARSETTGKPVDLVALATSKGAEAVEIANVQEAYHLLTAQRLPEPVPVPEADMALDPATIKGIDAKYRGWQQRLAGEWAALLQLQQAGRLPELLAHMAQAAQREAEKAQQLHDKGLVAGAYAHMLAAWIYAASATDVYDIVSKVRRGDAAGALAQLRSLDQLDQLTHDAFARIGALRPATLGDHLLVIGAAQAALRAWGFKEFARDSIGTAERLLEALAQHDAAELGAPAVADQLVAQIAPTVVLIGQTVAWSALAQEELDFMPEKSVDYLCSIPNIQRMSTSFQSAGAAGVNYFETLLVEPVAKQAGVPLEQARTQLALREPEYLVAFMLSRLQQADGLPRQLKDEWGEHSAPWNLVSLAGSELAYYGTAELIAKYYSLGLQTDASGRVTVAHDKAFTNMLATAERSARTSARAARIATGSIPVQAKLAYQQASIARDGDLDDKLEALSQFWMASAYSQTAVMLARN